MRRRLFALIVAAAIPSLGLAFGAAGSYSSPYLKLPMGARAFAMGDAFAGLANDINAMYYNPAGLSQVDHTQAMLMHMESFGGVRYENLAVAVPADALDIDTWATIGFSYTLMSVEDMLRTRIAPGSGGLYDQAYADRAFYFTSGASVMQVSYAWQAAKFYSLGGSIKIINEKVDTTQGWGFAGDVGILTNALGIPGVSAGVSVQNIGSSPNPEAPLPIQMRIGLGHKWKAPFTKEDDSDLLSSAVDFLAPIAPVDGIYKINFGTEYKKWFDQKWAALRLGYRFPTDTGLLSGLTSGIGFGTSSDGADIGLDYTFVPYGDLGFTHRVAMNLAFGAKPRVVKPKVNGPLVAPSGLKGEAGDAKVSIRWDASKVKVEGYNIYMSYDPAKGQWYKLTGKPVGAITQTIGKMYNGTKVFFAVTAARTKSDGTFEESQKSEPLELHPKAAAK